jgi:hypothetical protein
VGVLLVEAAKNGEHKSVVGDQLADISKGVGQGLELGIVLMHGHVTLGNVAELGVEVEGATLLVFIEKVVDGGPDLPGLCTERHDHAEELEGDGAIDPVEDGEVITSPHRGGEVSKGPVLASYTWAVRP